MTSNADWFRTLIAGTVIIQYNPHLDAYCIGPENNIPHFKMFRVLKQYQYQAEPLVLTMDSDPTATNLTVPTIAPIPRAQVTFTNMTAFGTVAASAAPAAFGVTPVVFGTVPAAPTVPVPDAANVQITKATEILEGFLLFRNHKYAEYCEEQSRVSKMHKLEFCK